MSTPTATADSTLAGDVGSSSDWLTPYIRWTRIPSWFLSALIHVGLIVTWIALSQSPGCQADIGVGDGAGFREVGLVTRPSDAAANDSDDPRPEGPEIADQPLSDSPSAEDLVAESLSAPPSIGASSPSSSLPILGAGPPEMLSGTANNLLQPSESGAPQLGGSPAPGSASLFGVNDSGQRFVYVIDNSGSMNSFQALQAAKNELTRSVEALDEEQQFLVIFYNVELTIIAPRSAPQRMFQGTDVHRLDLSQQITPITGDGGTDHVLALRESLKYHADVIFFLTDAGRPGLSTAEIEDITARNGGASRIHCIEFGENPDFAANDPSNSLRRLADMNNGRYTYKDVRTFR